MKHLAASLVLLTLVLGCSAKGKFSTVKIKEFNFDKVWVGAIDAVTNRMELIDSETSKEKRKIVAHTDGKWERRTATILIVEGVEGYDVKVKTVVEKNRMLLGPGGLVVSDPIKERPARVTKPSDLSRQGNRWKVTGDDFILRYILASDIKKAVKRLQ